MRFSNTLMLLCCIGLCACSATGLDAQKSFSCKAPAGIGCSSLSGVYANALANNLPGSATGKPNTVYSKPGLANDKVVGEAPATGTPVLSAPTVLRVWIAPWQDENKVLHDQAFLYAVANPGHWQVAHSMKRIANQYRVLAPSAKQPQPVETQTGQPQYQIPQSQPAQVGN
jgi:conjugal transfer pilus assembly protein TraV